MFTMFAVMDIIPEEVPDDLRIGAAVEQMNSYIATRI
jgi:hypothetical protein